MRIRMTIGGVGAVLMLACGGQGKGEKHDPVPPPTVPARPSAPPVDGPTNVLLVVLDDVGVDHLAAFGGPYAPPTPTLDRLAREGVRFTRTWSHPVCSPTRSSILTGRYARRTGIGMIIDSWKDEPELAESEITIPEMLVESHRRWDSSAIGKWHLASRRGDPATHPGRQGFGWWAGTLGNLRDGWNGDRGGGFGYDRWMKNDNGRVKEATGYVTSDTVDDAVARMGEMREPWFMYVAFNAAHFPPHVPPPQLVDARGLTNASPQADLYDVVLRSLDRELGRMLDAMPPKLRARTTVMVVGDNGTPDFAVRPPLDPERAKGSLYELGIHVPLIVTGPYVGQPGSESRALVHTVDLFSTVAEIAGVDPNRLKRKIDGVSILPSIRDSSGPGARTFVYSEKFAPNGPGPYDRETVAVRDHRYKLIVDRKKRGSDELLFDLEAGAGEEANLLAGGKLSSEQDTAYRRLKGELERVTDDLRR